MTNLTTTTQRLAEIKRIKDVLGTESDAKVLSAMGHPGYGERFSAKVLYEYARNAGQSLHTIIYSGKELGI